jgi:DNA (cytosine-5)-methyltransferase 1
MFTLTGQDIHGVMIANTVRAEHHNSDNAPMTVQDDGLIRRLTPKECGRLQGFPDNWAKIGVSNKNLSGEDCAKQIKANLKTKILRTIHVLNWDEYLIADQQQYKVFGNAVTVNVIQELGELILDYVEANPEVLAE